MEKQKSILENDIKQAIADKQYIQTEINDKLELLDKRELELAELKDLIDDTIEEKQMQYPWLAQVFADVIYYYDQDKAKELENRPRPAYKAAEQVREIAQEKRELQKWCKLLEYQLNFYENAFPWLEDIKEANIYEIWENTQAISSTESDNADEYVRMKNWLSPDEYTLLSTQGKYQLALDRYQKRNKSNWEVGIEFERYIGYLFEKGGEKVRYNGAIKGLEDMGRDLIVEKDDKIRVVQCKRWATHKTIHEKHIFQLYGSMVMLSMTNPAKPVEGVFITTAPLSETAQQCADYLHITVRQMTPEELPDNYPVIKCNISRRDGTKIYHLPFDQQYDKVVIEPDKGEFYATTIAEAEAAGFRRAWRHTNIS